mgnify:CR=1 FL=1
MRAADDANHVAIDLEFNTAAEAEGLLAGLRKLWGQIDGTIITGPTARIAEVVEETAYYLAIGAMNVMHTIDPDGVVFGGAMTFGEHSTPLGRRFLARIQEEVERRAFPVLAAKTKIDYASLGGDAGYIGAMGSRRTTERRHQRLLEEGLTEAELARVHAPIGLSIGSKTPEEVAVAVAAEIVRTFRVGPVTRDEARAQV